LTFNRVKELLPELRRTILGRVGRRSREIGQGVPKPVQFLATRRASGKMLLHLIVFRGIESALCEIVQEKPDSPMRPHTISS
jgi:hypothetical protein